MGRGLSFALLLFHRSEHRLKHRKAKEDPKKSLGDISFYMGYNYICLPRHDFDSREARHVDFSSVPLVFISVYMNVSSLSLIT